MNYAVIRIQGHQEIVNAETQNLIVDKLDEKEGSVIKPPVLLVSMNEKVDVGTPLVDFPVQLEVVKHQKGEKIYVSRFSAKARHRRKIGFRPQQTVLKVVKFGDEKMKESKEKATVKEKETKEFKKKTVRKTRIKTANIKK